MRWLAGELLLCSLSLALLVYEPRLDFVYRALRILVKSGLTFH